MSGFKQFVLRGNVVDMAVGVVVGGAFTAVVAALTKDLLTPMIAALVGKPNFSAIRFTVNGSVFALGDFIKCSGLVPVDCRGYLLLRNPSNQCTDDGRIKTNPRGVCRSRARHGGRVILSR
jgi:Large-conductance mechanosensitive channel, MscL